MVQDFKYTLPPGKKLISVCRDNNRICYLMRAMRKDEVPEQYIYIERDERDGVGIIKLEAIIKEIGIGGGLK